MTKQTLVFGFFERHFLVFKRAQLPGAKGNVIKHGLRFVPRRLEFFVRKRRRHRRNAARENVQRVLFGRQPELSRFVL